MAKPITPTPILTGEEAEKFIKEMDNPKSQKASKQEVERAKQIYETIMKNNREIQYAI